MEYWIDLKIKPKSKYSNCINRFIESVLSGDIGNFEGIFSELGDEALEKYTTIANHEYYGSYINGLQGHPICKETNNTSIEITTGGMGPEFSVALVDLLGEFCDEITADVTHDEDFGHIPVKLTYANGVVYENGSEISLRNFDEEEIDSWAAEPIVDKDVLEQIYAISKKATADTSFLQLTNIYRELYDPIIAVGTTHNLLTATLDGDDKQEYEEYIEEVLNLEYYKKEHHIFAFFKNLMYENLQKISTTQYLGSIFHEYQKTLVTFYVICDAANTETEGSFEGLFEDMHEQDDFEIVYEMTALFGIGDG